MLLPGTGKRISSRDTFFVKRVLPLLFFGMLALLLAIAWLSARPGQPPPAAAFAVPSVMATIFYFVLRRTVLDLADEVFDEGDALRVRIGPDEERIALADIINVSYAGMTNPARVTLTLRSPGRFGKEIIFSPQQSWLMPLFRPNPLVNELIERVDAARRR